MGATVYADFFEGLRHAYSGSAAVFNSMRRDALVFLFKRDGQGEYLPL